MGVGDELVIRIHPKSQEKYLEELKSYTSEELLWVVAFRQKELLEKLQKAEDLLYLAKTTEKQSCFVCGEVLDVLETDHEKRKTLGLKDWVWADGKYYCQEHYKEQLNTRNHS